MAPNNNPAPRLAIDGPLIEFAAVGGTIGNHAAFARPALDGQTPPRLPAYARFADLVAANIVRNWPQLLRLIEFEGFPRGIQLSRNARAWEIEEVQAWLASRPPAGQGGAPRLPAAMPPADLGTTGLDSRRDRSGRARPLGKPRKTPSGGDLSEKEAGDER